MSNTESDTEEHGGGVDRKYPSGTVVLMWSSPHGVSGEQHRIAVGGAGNDFVLLHQTRRFKAGSAWRTKDTWETEGFPNILPNESEQHE